MVREGEKVCIRTMEADCKKSVKGGRKNVYYSLELLFYLLSMFKSIDSGVVTNVYRCINPASCRNKPLPNPLQACCLLPHHAPPFTTTTLLPSPSSPVVPSFTPSFPIFHFLSSPSAAFLHCFILSFTFLPCLSVLFHSFNSFPYSNTVLYVSSHL